MKCASPLCRLMSRGSRESKSGAINSAPDTKQGLRRGGAAAKSLCLHMHRRRGKTHSVSPKHDLAQHMPGGEALMRLGGVGEREGRCDGNLRLRRLQRVAEMLELANSCLPIIRDGLDAAPLLRLGLDSVRIGELAAVANCLEAARERVASGEREHG